MADQLDIEALSGADLTDFQAVATADYSTSEHLTGAKWTGGALIYRKVVDCGAGPNNTIKTIAHGITGLGTVTDIRGMASDGTNQTTVPRVNPFANTDSIGIDVNATDISVYSQSNKSTHTVFVILEYTKTA